MAQKIMFKDFSHHIAWTDTMKSGDTFIGLIEYQSKTCGASVQVLQVISPDCICANEAEYAADKMLQQIHTISENDEIIYSDGIRL